MKDPIENPARLLFSSAFSQALASALSGAAGSAWELHAVEALDVSPVRADLDYFTLTFTGTLAGKCSVEFERSEAAMLGLLALTPTGEGAPSADQEPAEPVALLNLLQSAMDEFAELLTPGRPVASIEVARAEAPAAAATSMVMISAAGPAEAKASLLLYIDPRVIERLGELPASDDAAARKPTAVADAVEDRSAPAIAATTRPAAAETDASRPVNNDNLKLVMDVELNVTLRFGQRRLSLREVLDLSNGSVIELDRQVDEPVELLLDGKVIAHGEAVVIDGYYGLRVTEVSRTNAYDFGQGNR